MSSVWKKTQQVQKRLFARKQQREIGPLIRRTERAIELQNRLFSRSSSDNQVRIRKHLKITSTVWDCLCSSCRYRLFRLSEIEKEKKRLEGQILDLQGRRRKRMTLDELVLDLAEKGEEVQEIMEGVEHEIKEGFKSFEESQDLRRMGMVIQDLEFLKVIQKENEEKMEIDD